MATMWQTYVDVQWCRIIIFRVLVTLCGKLGWGRRNNIIFRGHESSYSDVWRLLDSLHLFLGSFVIIFWVLFLFTVPILVLWLPFVGFSFLYSHIFFDFFLNES